MRRTEQAVPLEVRGGCAAEIPPNEINFDHIPDEVKMRVWRQAKTLKGVVIECVAG